MDLFGIGFGEIVLILIVALMIFGPGRLPEIARTIGRFSRSLKRMSSDFTSAMAKEIDMEEEQKNLKKMSTDLKTDLTKGLSLGDSLGGHIDLSTTPSQQQSSSASAAGVDAPSAQTATTPVVKHD